MSNEQDIINFCEITGASTEVANNFLQIADNNLESAIQLFMDNGELVSGAQHTTSNRVSRPASIQSDEANDYVSRDEELARQMQEEDEVRAPIAPKTEILAGGGMFQSSPPQWDRRHLASSRPSVFNQGDSATGAVTDFLSRLESDADMMMPSSSRLGSEVLSSPSSAKTKRLVDLFRPPFDIMYHGNFEEARETAKEKSKWLLINVQDQTEFACQVMNRDVWSETFVKDIVRESFIFLQYKHDSPDGKRYSTFYTVGGFPHVAIVDARTGERVKVWERNITPADFKTDITLFLEENEPGSNTNGSSAGITKKPRVAKSVSDMSEEEQLNAAIAASLNASKSTSPETSNMDIETTSNKGKEKQVVHIDNDHEDVVAVEEESQKAGSALDGIKAVKRDETTDMVNSTRIQLRMADGSRHIRRFLKTDLVRNVFEYVKAEVPNAETEPFELVFNRTQLIDLLDQTILEAGLSNAAVNCVFI